MRDSKVYIDDIKDAQELELKALEYHIRAMATLAGIKELEKQILNH